jgi:hypothetical protein
MKYIIVIICSILLPIFSLKKITPKLCVNCKFFVNDFAGNNKYGKCSLFPTEISDMNYFVTGIQNMDYYYCSVARQYENLCGKEGNSYKNNPTLKKSSKL